MKHKTLNKIMQDFERKYGSFELCDTVCKKDYDRLKHFIAQSIKDALEACRVEEKTITMQKRVKRNLGQYRYSTLEDGADITVRKPEYEDEENYQKATGYNEATTQYDENVKLFIGEK